MTYVKLRNARLAWAVRCLQTPTSQI